MADESMLCEHANEVPMVCRCPPDCYCRQNGSCFDHGRLKIVPMPVKQDDTWTPRQLIAEFLADMDSGRLKPKNLLLMCMVDEGEHAQRPHWYFANVNRHEEIALLTLALHRAIDAWRNP
jgi:hypothetical protein